MFLILFSSSYFTAFDSVEEVTSATTAAVRTLFTVKESLSSASPFLDTMKVLSPVWLRSQSHFVRTLASELSLLLQVRLYNVCLCNFMIFAISIKMLMLGVKHFTGFVSGRDR